jgi:hypothetical protein
MSGGSFNYLCFREAGDIFGHEDDLAEMAAELAALGHQAQDVATRTRALIDRRDEINDEIAALKDVWQAVEWWRSCDRSREDVFIAIGRYREREERP